MVVTISSVSVVGTDLVASDLVPWCSTDVAAMKLKATSKNSIQLIR